jgi:hypothetical protein
MQTNHHRKERGFTMLATAVSPCASLAWLAWQLIWAACTSPKTKLRVMRTRPRFTRLCDGNYVDGIWTHTNPKCEDRVAYKIVASPSSYVTVKVDPASPRLETAAIGRQTEGR